MKRIVIYGSLFLILGTFAAAWAAGVWLLESPGGVRWLLRELSRRTPVTVEARVVAGGIGKTLRMEGVTVRWPHGEATAEELRLRCRPLLLPFGHLAVQELSLRGVRLRDDEPDSGKPPDLSWPRVTGAPEWLDAGIDRFRVDGLEYRRLQQPPVTVTRVAASLEWRRAALSATGLEVVIPEGRAAGTVMAGFGRPSLAATLTYTPVRPLGRFSRFDLRARLRPGRSPGELAGPLTLAAFTGPRKILELSGVGGAAGSTISLTGGELLRPGRGGTVRGEGAVVLTAAEPRVRLALRVAGLDLAEETGTATDLSGTLSLGGTVGRYAGRFDLDNRGKGWRAARLRGSFAGDGEGMAVTGAEGLLLGGTVRGGLRLGWAEAFTLAAELRGENLDPARVTPEWSGVVNLDLRGSARWSGEAPLRAEVSGHLRESRLRGLPLKGEFAARAAGGELRIDRLLLAGNGFDIHADGDLARRLNLTARIADLSGLVPGAGGKLDLQGWAQHAGGQSAGAMTGSGRDLAFAGVRIAGTELAVRLDPGPGSPVEITAALQGVASGTLRADSASLKLRGTRERHTLELVLASAGADIRGSAAGGYGQHAWEGEITALSGSDLIGPWRLANPVRLSLSSRNASLSPLVITGVGPERLELKSRLDLAPLRGTLRADWRTLDLSRANQWLSGLKLSGVSSGELRLESPTGERLNLNGYLDAAGKVTLTDRTITVRQARLDLEAGAGGIRSALEFGTAEGIRVRSRFTSRLPARLAIPEGGELDAAWEGVDLALFRRYLPAGLDLHGILSGTVTGRLLPGEHLDLTGSATLTGGAAQWRSGGRQLAATVRKSDLSWSWRGEALSGTTSLALAERGEAFATFSLPLPARLTSAIDPDGPVRGTLRGEFHEKGMLVTLFPGLVQESRGEVTVELQADGVWKEPRLTGRLELAKAGAYLPAAGITLTEVQLAADLDRDRITVNRVRVTSGSGELGGNAVIRLSGNRVTGYEGRLRGEKFQVVRLPELQVQASPDITFSGTPEQLAVRGTIRVPELLATGRNSATVISPSSDVIVARGAEPPPPPPRLALDIQVAAVLGDRVLVKAEGFDGKLEGNVAVAIRGMNDMRGTGEIRVTRGRYSAYGVTLDIRRGRVIFAGGPLERPTLDILALREVGDIKAGVTVRGTPAVPILKLYADPAKPDVEILSYIVLGRELNSADPKEKSDLLMSAASLLTSTGESEFLQEQIKQRLGIDTFGVTKAKEQTSDYRKIESSIYSTSQKTASSSVAESMLQVGKYLSPQLYVSYGWSIFNDSHLFKIRYNITKQWEVETRTGSDATGGDIFYRIEFD